MLKSFSLQAQLSYRMKVIVRKCSSTDKLALSSCPVCGMDAANLSAKSRRARPAQGYLYGTSADPFGESVVCVSSGGAFLSSLAF